MARMMRDARSRWILILPIFSIVGFGCGPDAKDQKISELTAERNSLQDYLDDRDREIADARISDEDAQKTIDELNRQLVAARTEKRPKEIDGWITMPGFDMISIPGSVLFASGKATLTTGGRQTMDRIAQDIRSRYFDRDIYVFGHTDDEPIRKSGWKDNWELGANRALNVVRHLASAGVPPGRIVQANCGPFRPKTPGKTKGARKQNRRVEFYAVERTSGPPRRTAARMDDG